MWLVVDALRRSQGDALDAFGLGPTECRYQVLASDAYWRLRKYAGGTAGPPLLIVAAPIKRPYIWDLAPSASAVRRCLQSGLSVYLLEWTSPHRGASIGLEDFASHFLSDAVGRVTRDADGAQPFLMGHSLGGTLSAIFAAFAPRLVRGLVLLASPLSFTPCSSRLRDALVAIVPASFPAASVVPGALLSHLVCLADPATFQWSRLMDAVLSMGQTEAAAGHTRVERWALDEVPLPGKLVHEILEWLYREDRFCRGRLFIRNTAVGPSCLTLPTLAVVNTADAVAPPASVRAFINAMPDGHASLIEHESEIGVGLPHLAILIGRRAHAQVWPRIISWLEANA